MYLTRNIETKIIEWINRKDKKPLAIFGSRQCGKTTTIKYLANKHYSEVFYINLLDMNIAHHINFLKKNPSLNQLLLLINEIYNNPIIDNTKVIIIDEIQEVIELFSQLKIINETRNDLNIVVLGSYLGMKLFTSKTLYPIGQIEQLEMFSLSFDEFLKNVNEGLYKNLIKEYEQKKISSITHEMATKYFNDYLVLGGFPEVVKSYKQNNVSFKQNTYQLRNNILSDYEKDIFRYIDNKDIVKAKDIFNHGLITMGNENNNFLLSTMKKCARFKDYEFIISLLQQAHICFKVDNCEAIKLPLQAKDRVNKFKLYFNDISLISSYFNLTNELADTNQFNLIKGHLCENYVLLELLRNNIKPYYHTFKYNQNQYEIDCVYEKDLIINAIEIKSSRSKKHHSLNMITKLNPKLNVTTLSLNPDINDKQLPIYLAFLIGRC